jgi:hypothetical protein
VAALAAACGEDDPPLPPPPDPLATPARVSGASPFAPGCNPAPQAGIRYVGSEVEPSLAASATDPAHLVAAWQQDRWSSGGADGLVSAASLDGGATWTVTPVPFSRCGGGVGRGGDYDRATDPWVSISADGATVHQIGLAFDASGGSARQAILVARSIDGGRTWSAATALATDSDRDFALDKPTLTADPAIARNVYAVWDRLTGLTAPDPRTSTGPAWFSRSEDGGESWTQAAVLHDPGPNAQTISSQIVVLPDGALVNVFVRITGTSGAAMVFELVAMRSTDVGTSWDPPVTIAPLRARGARDPKTGQAVRAGEVVPSTAVDRLSGKIHVAWEDARFSAGARDGIALSTSTDGGATWSVPVQVNGAPGVEAFRPAVAVAPSGALAVTYYDFRNDVPADPTRTWTTFWKAESPDGGTTWIDSPEGGPFDLRSAPNAGGWFVGDYTGLVPWRNGFAALFAMGGESTDVYLSLPPPPP